MKILLLNDNPVVTKLVILSAQKTDDEVVAAHSVEEVPEGEYDLLIIDDALYNAESFALLREKINFKKSLFVCSRENESEGDFSVTIKKPFLPTDMVELLTNTKRNLDTPVPEEEAMEDMSDEELLEDLELEGLEDLENLEDEALDLDDTEELGESILDDEEAQKVKVLLDETQDEEYDMALDLEDEADADISEDVDTDTDLVELGIEENDVEEIALDEEVDMDLEELELDEAMGVEDEALEEDALLESDIEEDLLENSEEDIESQIEDAIEELSDEELESEVDEETLLDIANSEIDSFENLSSRDLKAALGEELDEEEVVAQEDEDFEEPSDLPNENATVSSNRGVESLKTLLKTLSDENVAASLQGAKITINISFED